MSTEHDDRAQRGATLLDEEMPGWLDKIDTEKLDIGDGTMCILGQLAAPEGGFRTLAGRMFNAEPGGCFCCDPEVIAYGFTLDDGSTNEYHELTDSWRRIIEQRRNDWARILTDMGWFPSRDALYMISPGTGLAVSEDGCRIEPLAPVAA